MVDLSSKVGSGFADCDQIGRCSSSAAPASTFAPIPLGESQEENSEVCVIYADTISQGRGLEMCTSIVECVERYDR